MMNASEESGRATSYLDDRHEVLHDWERLVEAMQQLTPLQVLSGLAEPDDVVPRVAHRTSSK
jgi:hypothetical protein